MFARFAAAWPPWWWLSPPPISSCSIRCDADLGPIHLGDLLTWGAFTYPFAFLVSDLTNRYDGPRRARLVVVVGFVVALGLSFYLSTPRIAIASGTAFLIGQLLDIAVFSRLRNRYWLCRRLPPRCSARCSTPRSSSRSPSRRRSPSSTWPSACRMARSASPRRGWRWGRTCRCGCRWRRRLRGEVPRGAAAARAVSPADGQADAAAAAGACLRLLGGANFSRLSEETRCVEFSSVGEG